MIKKILSLSLLVMLITFPLNVFADNVEPVVIIDPDENGCYYETIIEYEPIQSNVLSVNSAASTRTGSKTVSYKNSADTVLWYVKVTGKFTYGNGSSKCTSSSVTAASKSTHWKITSSSASKNGNKAKASATARCKKDGATSSKTVTLTCDSSGKLS